MKTLALVSLFVCTALGPSFAHAAAEFPLPMGSYQGVKLIPRQFEEPTEKKAEFLVQPIPGREGSAIALLIEERKQGRAYIVDPTQDDPKRYAMMPLEFSEDGTAIVRNADPSLVITFASLEKGQTSPSFTIDNSYSPNRVGLQGKFNFESGDHSHLKWQGYVPGRYAMGGSMINASVIKDGEATVSISDDSNYVLRYQTLGVFSLHHNVQKATGAEVEIAPTHVVIFINDLLLLVNPVDGNVTRMYHRSDS